MDVGPTDEGARSLSRGCLSPQRGEAPVTRPRPGEYKPVEITSKLKTQLKAQNATQHKADK